MIDPQNVPDVGADEVLARFVLHRSHIRRTTRTVKPDAFIPHPYGELSVTRHLDATEEELSSIGRAVATTRNISLYGRADFPVAVCAAQNLAVRAAPVSRNPNHANITGWPSDKPSQKIIALEIAAAAEFTAVV